ncbi:MAG: hypothetical protein R3277_00075 [Brumimicrobium sp.]|nr:hypothetical protein [Brumimicrobium sp.]
MRVLCTIILVGLIFLSGMNCFAQKKSKLNTNGKGTLFGYAAYNRSAYAPAKVTFEGADYNFRLTNTRFSDTEDGTNLGNFFDSGSPQFNLHLGYYFANKWALTFGMDRLNYFMREGAVTLDGSFAPGAHADFTGNYNDQNIDINRDQIFLRQQSGVNFFRIGVQRTDQWYKSRKGKFAFNTNAGIGLGALFSSADFTFDGSTAKNVTSLSGIGLSAHAGLRFDFFQHLFLHTMISGGVLNQRNVLLSSDESESSKHVIGYISPEIGVGFILFARPTNGCGTCPQW